MIDYTPTLIHIERETGINNLHNWELILSFSFDAIQDVCNALYYTQKKDLHLSVKVLWFGKVKIDFSQAKVVYQEKDYVPHVIVPSWSRHDQE